MIRILILEIGSYRRVGEVKMEWKTSLSRRNDNLSPSILPNGSAGSDGREFGLFQKICLLPVLSGETNNSMRGRKLAGLSGGA